MTVGNNANICIPEEFNSTQDKSPCIPSTMRAHAISYSIFQSPSVSLSKHMAQA